MFFWPLSYLKTHWIGFRFWSDTFVIFKSRFRSVFSFASSKLHIRSLDLVIHTRSVVQKPVLSFSVSADPTDALLYYALAFNILLSLSVSVELADTLI